LTVHGEELGYGNRGQKALRLVKIWGGDKVKEK